MKSTIAAVLTLAIAATACDIPMKKQAPPAEQGLGAGAAPAAPAPTPIDTTTAAMQPNTPTAVTSTPVAPAPTTTATRPTTAKKPAKVTDQTQSGVTDASGSSTLGQNIKKARPDQDQPVTAKGDVLVARWDSANGGWTYRKVGDTTAVVRTPGDTKGDSAFNQQKGDSLKPIAPPSTPAVPVTRDSLGAEKGDTAFQRTQRDSTRIQGSDTMSAPRPNTMPVMPTLPQPTPQPLPTPNPAPAPIPPR